MRLIDADELMESIRKALGIKSMTKSLLLPVERTIIDQIDNAPTVSGWLTTWDDKLGKYVTHWMPLPEPPKEEKDDDTTSV